MRVVTARRLQVEKMQQGVELFEYNNLGRTSSRANEEIQFAAMKLKPVDRKSSRSSQSNRKMKARTVSLAPTHSTMVSKECRPLSQKMIIIKT